MVINVLEQRFDSFLTSFFMKCEKMSKSSRNKKAAPVSAMKTVDINRERMQREYLVIAENHLPKQFYSHHLSISKS